MMRKSSKLVCFLTACYWLYWDDWQIEFDEQNLTLAQIRLLVVLVANGPSNIGEIAGYLHIGQSAASLLVDRLVQDNLAERADDPADRRRSIVRLSSHGEEMTRHRIANQGRMETWLRGLDDAHLTKVIDVFTAVVELLGKNDVPEEVSSGKSPTR